jgi:hypothetical protein
MAIRSINHAYNKSIKEQEALKRPLTQPFGNDTMSTMNSYRLIIYTSLLCLLLPAILQGCATPGYPYNLSRVESQKLYIGIFVDKPFTLSRNKQSMTWPDGIYKIKYEDEHGFYFYPPSRIKLSPFRLGDRVLQGGLYVRKSDGAVMVWAEEIDSFLWVTVELVILNMPAAVEYKFININDGVTIRQEDIPGVLTPKKGQEKP